MLEKYRIHVEERAALGIPPLPLDAEQTRGLVELIQSPPQGEEEFLVALLTDRVPAGVDPASHVKAGLLAAVAKGEAATPLISAERAVELLGTMLGGFNVAPLVELLDHETLGGLAADQLKHTLLIFDTFDQVKELAAAGNSHAQSVLDSWANAEWFTSRDKVAEKIVLTIFMVSGETNTDDLSPATDAFSRPDIPLHSLCMLKNPREGIDDAIGQIAKLRELGHPIAYVGDVVGTGSSRKSASNSVLWHLGKDIPYVPNKRSGGYVIGGNIAPIFFNTLEDSGALPIECDVARMEMGDVITLYPYEGRIENSAGETISTFELKTDVLLDEVQAGGRIPLIIGR
ncbi:MAG: aconitate hydratase B, partial [Myxococcota bacterium]